MTKSLGARCHTFSDSSDRSRGRGGAPIAFAAVILLLLTVVLPFGTMKAEAALTVRDTNGAQICRFEENGDLYLSGVLVEYGGDTIPSLPAGSDCWRILNSDGSVLLWLFKSEATVGNVTYYPGDMILAGSVSGGDSSPTGDYIWRLKDASSNVVAQLTEDGDLQLRYADGQDYVSDKVFTNSSLTASIASDSFKYDSSDLDFTANKGNAYTIQGPTNPRPTDEYDPQNDDDFPKWYDTTESYHGSGDLWVTTWVKNDNDTPVLLMANGDGYGLSYRPFAGSTTSDILAYQPDQNENMVWYPCWSWAGPFKWRLLPSVAISRFHGTPGEGYGTSTNYLGWTFSNPLAGHGETIARFLWSDSDLVNEYGELVSDVMSTNKIPNEPEQFALGGGVYKNSSGTDSHSHRTPRELKPTGLIHFNDGSTDGVTYLACHDHNPNHPFSIPNTDSKNWHPTAAAQHAYIFKSEDQGETWGPNTDEDETDHLPRLLLSNRIWADYKFTTPAFCQFGMAYGDYGDAFPGESTKYLYAFSPHERWWNQDNLYLARAVVYDSTNGWHTDEDDMLDADKWEYWVGTDSTGQPIWASGNDSVSKAAPILHAKGEIAQPSVIYHKDSGLYLMATFSNSGRNTLDGWHDETICHNDLADTSVPVGGKVDPHWILWQAPKPWGPWKKVFTNDYNGLQTDYHKDDGNPAHDMDRKGSVGYNVQIMPSWTSSSGVGEWSLWVLHAGFVNFFRNADQLEFQGGAVKLDHPLFGEMDWLEGGYTLEFSQISLSQKTKPINASLSPMYQHEQNNTPSVSASAITVGYHFTLTEDRKVTHLGRYFVTGNSGTHTLKIVEVELDSGSRWKVKAGGISVAKNLNLSGFDPELMDENGFVYVKLDSVVQLYANTHYLLLSSEGGTNTDVFFGGKRENAELDLDSDPDWYFKYVLDLPDVATDRILQIADAARTASDSSKWDLYNSGLSYPLTISLDGKDIKIYGLYGNTYGGVNLLFQKESGAKAPWAMHSTTGQTVISPVECLAGTRFTMTGDVIVSALGRLKVNNNSKVHEVRLMLDNDDGSYTTIASIPIRMYPSAPNNDYVYRDLATPVRLESGKTYVLVSREFSGVSENCCDECSMAASLGSVFSNSRACWFEWTSNSVGTRHDGTSEYCYAGVNLKYH